MIESTAPCIKCGGDLESNLTHSPLGSTQQQLRLTQVCLECGRESSFALAMGKVKNRE